MAFSAFSAGNLESEGPSWRGLRVALVSPDLPTIVNLLMYELLLFLGDKFLVWRFLLELF
eukprot:CAMPEP_0170508012 /NCGR_PEP_ID=MMETSP0208-20121228/60921_1 /TAXON_ID=197538 /ORGANISM="Strombidium inclinatum, Strain S3" /LENGTH=59 /DNA_ID=CAMNT_0010790629 /DNA_START=424 /DNA_END=603 /DNA_ORIENTATION=-